MSPLLLIFILLLSIILINTESNGCEGYSNQSNCLDQKDDNCVWDFSSSKCESFLGDYSPQCNDLISQNVCLTTNKPGQLCLWIKGNGCQNNQFNYNSMGCVATSDYRYSQQLCQDISPACAFDTDKLDCYFADSCSIHTSKQQCMNSLLPCVWDFTDICTDIVPVKFSCGDLNLKLCNQISSCYSDNGTCKQYSTKSPCDKAKNIYDCYLTECTCNQVIILKYKGKWDSKISQCNFVNLFVVKECQGLNKYACRFSNSSCVFESSCYEYHDDNKPGCDGLGRVACFGRPECIWLVNQCIIDGCQRYNNNEIDCKTDPINLCMWNSKTRNCKRSVLKSCIEVIEEKQEYSLFQSYGSCMNVQDTCIWHRTQNICAKQQTLGLDFCKKDNFQLNQISCRQATVACKNHLRKCQDFDISIDNYLSAYNQPACSILNSINQQHSWVLGKCVRGQSVCETLNNTECLESKELCLYDSLRNCVSLPSALSLFDETNKSTSFGTCMQLKKNLKWVGNNCSPTENENSCSNLNYYACMTFNMKCSFQIIYNNKQGIWNQAISSCQPFTSTILNCQLPYINKQVCLSSGCVWDNELFYCQSEFTCSSDCNLASGSETLCAKNPKCNHQFKTKQLGTYINSICLFPQSELQRIDEVLPENNSDAISQLQKQSYNETQADLQWQDLLESLSTGQILPHLMILIVLVQLI